MLSPPPASFRWRTICYIEEVGWSLYNRHSFFISAPQIIDNWATGFDLILSYPCNHAYCIAVVSKNYCFVCHSTSFGLYKQTSTWNINIWSLFKPTIAGKTQPDAFNYFPILSPFIHTQHFCDSTFVIVCIWVTLFICIGNINTTGMHFNFELHFGCIMLCVWWQSGTIL